jgi:uncharacterized membrane protein
MTYLILGMVLFFGAHLVSVVALDWRNSMAAKLGENAWKGLYSVIAIAGFVLMVWGYGLARQDPVLLYAPPVWLRHLSALLMLPVFPLLLAAYLPGRIKAVTKHPMLAATKFWALAHLLANGALGDVLLFGGFLAWAVVDRISFKHREQRPIPAAPPSKANDIVAVVIGLLIYFAFVKWLHVRFFGVVPM